MDFGNALNALRAGHKVARASWDTQIEWLKMHQVETMTTIFSQRAASPISEWIPMLSEILASDWEIVD